MNRIDFQSIGNKFNLHKQSGKGKTGDGKRGNGKRVQGQQSTLLPEGGVNMAIIETFMCFQAYSLVQVRTIHIVARSKSEQCQLF